MASKIVVELQEKFGNLAKELDLMDDVDSLNKIQEFKRWFSNDLDQKKVPSFLIRKYTDSLHSLESSLSSGEKWKVRRELIWQGVELEKNPVFTFKSFNLEQMDSLTDDVTIIEDKENETILVDDDGLNVIVLRSLKGCTITIKKCKMLNLSNLSNCKLTITDSTNILYVNNFTNGSIWGKVNDQTRLHNSIDSQLNLSTSNIVIEDCFNLEISPSKELKVEDFNHPVNSNAIPTESFHWSTS